MENSEQPAFPPFPNEELHRINDILQPPQGLTKREHFAGLAMQGMLSAIYSSQDTYISFQATAGKQNKSLIYLIIEQSIQNADELLNQLNTKQDGRTT